MPARQTKKHPAQTGPELWRLDSNRIRWHMQRLALNRSRLHDRTGLSRHTIRKVLDGQGVLPATARELAHCFDVDPRSLLPSDSGDENGGNYQIPEHPEWAVVPGTLGTLVRTSSGLFARTCQLTHRHLPGERGRGKLYDLLGVADHVREAMSDQLTRHPQVCRRLRECPQVTDNLSVTAVDGGNIFWIVDRWFDGTTLAESDTAVRERPESERLLLLQEILVGLQALHEAQIVLRELAPARVLVHLSELRVQLTDLELAKLLDHGGTVSADWPTDPYRAPEVDGGTASPQADLYSWGRLAVELITGQLPECPADADLIMKSKLPKRVRFQIAACLAPDWEQRPASASVLLSNLNLPARPSIK